MDGDNSGTVFSSQKIKTPFCESTKFNPETSEDLRIFLREYNLCAELNGWGDELKCRFFTVYLEGSAKTWYNNLEFVDPTAKSNWDDLSKKFVATYSTGFEKYQWEEKLRNRKFREEEKAIHYYTDIIYFCRMFDDKMSDSLKCTYLINGLPPIMMKEVLLGKYENSTELKGRIRLVEYAFERAGLRNTLFPNKENTEIGNISSCSDRSTNFSKPYRNSFNNRYRKFRYNHRPRNNRSYRHYSDRYDNKKSTQSPVQSRYEHDCANRSHHCSCIFLTNSRIYLNDNYTLCQIIEKNGSSKIRILFDTGAGVSLVNSKAVNLDTYSCFQLRNLRRKNENEKEKVYRFSMERRKLTVFLKS
uniref:Retrotransposon gag domain-containing protein n=1 Tax=Cacopsylla melanoneura TaxID=428564 RepID=A0A8D8YP32_9HEMI